MLEDIATRPSGTILLIKITRTQAYHQENNKKVKTTHIKMLFNRHIRFIVARFRKILTSLIGWTSCNSFVGSQSNITLCINLSRVTMQQGLKTGLVRRPTYCTFIRCFQQLERKNGVTHERTIVKGCILGIDYRWNRC
jgi:hypothetical protein